VSTSAVDTWQTINFRTENLIEIPNEFLSSTQIPRMIQMRTHVLNLKTLKTQVSMGYLTLIFNLFDLLFSRTAYLYLLFV
jgi:hypothetical protein